MKYIFEIINFVLVNINYDYVALYTKLNKEKCSTKNNCKDNILFALMKPKTNSGSCITLITLNKMFILW